MGDLNIQKICMENKDFRIMAKQIVVLVFIPETIFIPAAEAIEDLYTSQDGQKLFEYFNNN